MAFNKADVTANAQSYGPKGPNKIVLYVNENKTSGDNKPSLYGYATDKDMMLSSVSVWKNKTKNDLIKLHNDRNVKAVERPPLRSLSEWGTSA